MPEFNEKLRILRESQGLTQLEAAIKLGIPKATWESWEQGRRNPDFVKRAWALKELAK